VYTAFSISPLIFINSPYHTALTPPLRTGGMLILLALRILRRLLPSPREQPRSLFRYFKGIGFDRTHFLVDEANSRAELLDPCAMRWLFTEDDFSDLSMDTFLETIPGYVHSQLADKERLIKQLTPSYILKRIRGHFLTCATGPFLVLEDARYSPEGIWYRHDGSFRVCTCGVQRGPC
jgi:hypothetical protein